LNRKEAIRAYKERKIPRGIFVLRCTATGEKWVGSALNLEAARNRNWFALRQRMHPDKALQKVWNDCGEQAFEYDILEKLPDDVAELSLSDTLKQKRLRWIAELGAAGL
jgi:hypothetical protein